MTTADGVSHILRFLCPRSFVSDLVSLVAVIDIDNITLFGKLDALFVGIFVKAPKDDSVAVRTAMVKAVGAAFLAYVLNIQIRLSAQSLDHLIEKSPGFSHILLVGRDGLGWRSCRRVRLCGGQTRKQKDG